jgi:hypothetical protein
MSKMKDCEPLHQVSARFPKSRVAIRKLFDEDEAFRELCVDYAECMAVLDRLHRGHGIVDDPLEQYCELRVNLEQELQTRIAESARRSAGN